jgi:hypothetical protein
VFSPSGPRAVKVTAAAPRSGDGLLLGVGSFGSVRPGGATGQLDDDTAWDVRFESTAADLRHLPYAWMYRARIPRTKSTSPYPAMRVTGTLRVDGRTLRLDRWPGMLGHNWGAEHAHRWIWLRGAMFAEDRDAWLDVVLGRIKVGPFVLPWIANGVLEMDGVRHRVGGLGRKVLVWERADGCDLVLPGRDGALTVQVAAPLATSVEWEYADPSGGRRQVRNCSVAAVRVDGTGVQLTSSHGGVYELGTTT